MYLTKRQRQMLDNIQKFINQNGYSPTLEEIGHMMGLSSPATVHKHLQNLEAKGMVRRKANHSRALELPPSATAKPSKQLPMLGYVAAGAPIEAVEIPETIEVPREFSRRGDMFALKVKGESMIEDGIFNGDTIIVERRETAQPGQTVVALVRGEEATVKRFHPEGRGKIRLQPANAKMKPLVYPAAQVKIQGIVVGLVRKYGK